MDPVMSAVLGVALKIRMSTLTVKQDLSWSLLIATTTSKNMLLIDISELGMDTKIYIEIFQISKKF